MKLFNRYIAINSFLFVAFLIPTSNFFANAQTCREVNYSIKGLNGKTERISINEDAVNDRLSVSHLAQRLCFLNYKHGVQYARLLDPNFYEICYGMPGGSGQHNASIVLLCISDNKLHVASPAFGTSKSYFASEVVESDSTSWSLLNRHDRLFLNVTNFKLVKDQRKTSKKKDHACKTTILLPFDRKNGVFCSGYRYLNQLIVVENPDDNPGYYTKRFKGLFPAVTFKGHQYFYCDGIWYLKISHNHFLAQVVQC